MGDSGGRKGPSRRYRDPRGEDVDFDYLSFEFDLNDPDTVSALDEVSLWSSVFGRVMLEHVPLRTGQRVLDVGCGTGFPLIELAQRLGSSSTIVGIDPWEAALARARYKAEVMDVRNIEFVARDATSMPFGDGEFDLIVSNLGINNFDDPPTVLGECWRVAKPDATLVLTTNLRGHMKEFYDAYAYSLEELGAPHVIRRLNRHIDHRATIESINTMFDEAGFKVARVLEETFTMRFANGSAFLRHYLTRIGFLDRWKAVVAPDEVEVFGVIEKNLNRVADDNGELRLTIPLAYVEGRKLA